MSTRLRDAPDLRLPIPATPASCVTGVSAAAPPAEPAIRGLPHARGAAHRPGAGCPCGCTFDSQMRRSIEPWNPPDGNDLGPLFIG